MSIYLRNENMRASMGFGCTHVPVDEGDRHALSPTVEIDGWLSDVVDREDSSRHRAALKSRSAVK